MFKWYKILLALACIMIFKCWGMEDENSHNSDYEQGVYTERQKRIKEQRKKIAELLNQKAEIDIQLQSKNQRKLERQKQRQEQQESLRQSKPANDWSNSNSNSQLNNAQNSSFFKKIGYEGIIGLVFIGILIFVKLFNHYTNNTEEDSEL